MGSLFAGLALFAAAATATAAESPTKDQVDRFASALEEIVAKSGQYDELSEAQRKELGDDVPKEFRDVIESHGFTESSWHRVGERVFATLTVLELERQQIRQELKEARERIQNNPELSAEQKDQMLNMLDEQQQAITDHDVSSADRAAVEAHRDRLMEITAGE